jgi:hypothetical protein
VRASFSVAIRTAVVDTTSGEAVYGTGSGITWGSEEAAEHDEVLAKAAVLAVRPREFELLETMAHDPQRGLRNRDRHLQRLAASADQLAADPGATAVGAATGAVAGLVAITPAAGFVSGGAPLAIGAAAGVICCFAVRLKFKAGYDDALDVVGVHFVGGLVGSLLIGLFANPEFFGGTFKEGLFHGGGLGLLGEQLLANVAAIVWSFALTFGIMKVLDATIGVRVSDDVETSGLDLAEHAETAYHAGTATMERA